MAIVQRQLDRGSHWYLPDGTPYHTVKAKDGSDRNTTLADARKVKALPSVNGIVRVLAAPGLETWKQQQVVMSAATNPRQPDEPEDLWVDRVIGAAMAQVGEAAALGSKIHKAIELGTNGEEYDSDLAQYVLPVQQWLSTNAIDIVEREKVVVDTFYGYGGTMDVGFRYGKAGRGVLDYKSKKTKPGKKVDATFEHGLQLAAYAAAYWGHDGIEDVLLANLYISTTEPGRIDVVKHKEPGLLLDTFLHCAAIWRAVNNYDPRK